MSLLPSEFEQIIFMKVVGHCLFLPPTKFHVIWPSKTADIGKILSSVFELDYRTDSDFFFVAKH
jgi:hypothetical protein